VPLLDKNSVTVFTRPKIAKSRPRLTATRPSEFHRC